MHQLGVDGAARRPHLVTPARGTRLSESTNKNLNSAFQAQLAKTDNNRDHSKENGRRNPSNSELETTRKFLNEFSRGGIVHRETGETGERICKHG